MARSQTYHLLLIRSTDDLCCAWRDLSALMALRRRQPSSPPSPPVLTLVGIWVDPSMVDAAPDALNRAAACRDRQFYVPASVGINGVWSLCSVVTDLDDGTARETARESLIPALLALRPSSAADAPQFIPVFDEHDPRRRAEARRLRARFPGLVGTTVTWNAATSALVGISSAVEGRES